MTFLTEPTQSAPPPKPRRSRRWRCLIPVGSVFLCLLALNAAVSLFISQWLSPVTVTFDMKGTVDHFMAQSTRQSLSPETRAQLAARFSQMLNRSLADYQQQHRALILVAPAVVSGGVRDITGDIQQDVARRMRHGDAR